MAEHQGFMLLYTETWGRNDAHRFHFVAPEEDFAKLWERAKGHVGEHHEADGMSTKPVARVTAGIHEISRNTSFGPRKASVEYIPILRE